MTNLLDMLKETDLRLNFTDVLKSSTAYETLDRSVLRPRLLLGLNGIGTNAGFQRMAGLQSGTTAKDLAYVDRPQAPQYLKNATGDRLVTDGQIAFLSLR